MANSPLISIILPVHNGARYLEQAVASCLVQTQRDWELIIVDDASSDDTPTILSRLAATDSRIHLLRNPVNRKLPASLNTGLNVARGTYLTWTSDDNLYRGNALEEMSSLLESRDDIDLVYSDYSTVDEEGSEQGRITVGEPQELLERNCIGASFLFRRAVFFDLGGYDETRFLTEDYDFWLRALARFRFCPHHVDLYLYRQHGASLTQTRREEIKLATDDLLESRVGGIGGVKAVLRARAFLSVAERHRRRGDSNSARRVFRKALRCAPWAVLRDRRAAPLVALLAGYRVAGWVSRLATPAQSGEDGLNTR